MTRDLVVFDIDGVLLDCQHRVQHWLDGDFFKYASLAHKDTPIPQGIAVCKMFVANPEFRTIFVTGRGDSLVHRVATLTQLQTYVNQDIHNYQLIMREWPLVDDLDDAQKKPLMIEAAGYSIDEIFMVFEDRDSIVQMWRDRGITCYQTMKSTF